MTRRADIVIIGSGGLGAATAFYLAKRGIKQIVLLDRHDIGSQTSPRAAGMVSLVRKSELMIDLIKLAVQKIKSFTRDTGQPLDWVQSGSLKIARRPQDAEVIAGDVTRGRRKGLDVEQISPTEAHRLNPFLRPEGIHAVMRVGDDMYFDPKHVAVGFAKAASANGAMLMPQTTVTRVNVEGGKVTGVETDRGTIYCAIVVDAAGAWARQIAEASGIRIPLVPTAQQLVVTEPLDGARADLPMVRIMDAAVYMRPCDEGFLWGVYEEEPQFFDMSTLDPKFDIKDMPLDAEILWRAAHDA